MMDLDALLAARQDPAALAETLSPEDISFLIGLLKEKNNDIRYAAFLTLKLRSMAHDDVYPFWDALAKKLDHENSYQRSIGVMLLAENVRWDAEKKLDGILEKYTERFRDEKFITARQAIQSLHWLAQRPEMIANVMKELITVPVDQLPPTQRKLVLMDILQALLLIQDVSPREEAAAYIFRALNGGLLAKKEKDAVLKRMGGGKADGVA